MNVQFISSPETNIVHEKIRFGFHTYDVSLIYRQKALKYVSDAIETRLRMVIPYIDKWPQALATLTLSRAVPKALSNLLTLVDDICYYAGDRSVDVSTEALRFFKLKSS